MSSKDITGSELFEYLEMGVTEGINYVLFKNPVSSTVIDSVKGIANNTIFRPESTTPKLPPGLEKLTASSLVCTGNPFVRLAGLSGAAAVILGAYGAHNIYTKKDNEEQKSVYQVANTYHFFHSLALLGVPLCRYPNTAGSLITIGTVLFCGTCYYAALTDDKRLRKLTPIGGVCLIFGWLCLVL